MIVEITEATDWLTIRCTDDGRGLPATITKGLGSRLFDEICADRDGEWSLSRRGHETCFALSLRVKDPHNGEGDAGAYRRGKAR